MNAAWDNIFVNVQGNKKAIRERGRGPLNCILLDDPEITRIMTAKDSNEKRHLPYGNSELLMAAPFLHPTTTVVVLKATHVPAPQVGYLATVPAVGTEPTPATTVLATEPSVVCGCTLVVVIGLATSGEINPSDPIMSKLPESIFCMKKRELQGKFARNVQKRKALEHWLEKVKDATIGRLV